MKKISLSILLIFLILVVQAQDSKELPPNSIQLFSAYSKHGTDNVDGFAMMIDYNHHFSKRFSWEASIGTTLHDGTKEVSYWDSSGNLVYGPVNFTTSGVQTGLLFGFDVVRTSRHSFQVCLGPLLRYQSTSNPDIVGLAITFPYNSRVDFPARTLSFGGIGTISYSYTFRNNLFVHLQACLQYDSNDDALNMFGVGVGKRFSKIE